MLGWQRRNREFRGKRESGEECAGRVRYFLRTLHNKIIIASQNPGSWISVPSYCAS